MFTVVALSNIQIGCFCPTASGFLNDSKRIHMKNLEQGSRLRVGLLITAKQKQDDLETILIHKNSI